MASAERILYIVNEAYFFISHRSSVADAAIAAGYEVHVAAPEDHVWAPEGFSLTCLTKRGYHVHPLSFSRRGTNPFVEILTLFRIWALFRSVRPTIVHLITIKPVLYGGIVARLMRLPAISHVTGLGHAFIAKGVSGVLLRSVVIPLYRFVGGARRTAFIVQNEGDRKVLSALNVAPDRRVHLIPGSGVDLEMYPMTPEVQGSIPMVILPARLIWEKGIAEFVDAARILKGRGTEVRMILVGDTKNSNPRAVPEEKIRAWVAQGLIEWMGRRNDMPNVLAQCQIVCLPTVYGEGVPKILLEAAATGRPIVSTDIAGCREVVEHEVNGLLVPPGDSLALADAVERLINDVGLRARMGQSGRRIAEKKFSDALIANQTIATYRLLVEQCLA